MNFTYQVLEDNAGGLHLAVFEGDKCIYFSSGYENNPENLPIDLKALENGESPRDWDVYPTYSETPQELYDSMTSYEYGWEIVADETSVYPNKMGSSASIVLFPKIVEQAKAQITEKDYVKLMDKARHIAIDNGLFTDDPNLIFEEWGSGQYLVEDMRKVIQAHFDDLAIMQAFNLTIEDIHVINGAEKWAKRHGIKILG